LVGEKTERLDLRKRDDCLALEKGEKSKPSPIGGPSLEGARLVEKRVQEREGMGEKTFFFEGSNHRTLVGEQWGESHQGKEKSCEIPDRPGKAKKVSIFLIPRNIRKSRKKGQGG